MTTKEFKFVNSVGDTFDLYPMNPLEEELIREQMRAEWKEAGMVMPDKPVYTLTTASGETQRIKVKDEKEAVSVGLGAEWTAYKEADAAFEKEYGERYLTSCFACIKANPDDYPAWKTRLKMRRLRVPDDEADKLIMFGKTWVVRSTDDITGLIIACTRSMVNISEEAAKAAEEKFRLTVEGEAARLSAAE